MIAMNWVAPKAAG